MADARRWLFTKEQLQNTPSRADGVDPKKELSYRQQAASLIFDIGQKLNVNQNCVSTAVVFVHRFYMFHSFKKYQRSTISTSALFLACKVEEQPRKLEYVVKVAYSMMNQGKSIDSQSQEFQQMSDEVTVHELLILETLGFDVIVEHPHPYVVKCIQLIRASKDLGQTAYFMAHNSLLMTTMCLEYQPSAVACVCIHLACHWKEIEIPKSSDNKHWWEYINSSVDLDMLNRVADEFLRIYESCPSKIKKKMLNQLKGKQASGQPQKVPPSGGEPSSSGSHPPAPPPADLQHSYLKPLPPRDRPKPQPGTTQQQSTSMDKPDPSVPTSGTGSGSGKKPIVVKNLPVLPPLTMSEEKKPSLVLPPLPRREGEERSRSPKDSGQSDKRSSSTQQRPSSHGHHKHRHGEGRPPPPPHQQKYHDSSVTSSHQLHQHTTAGTLTAAHGGHKRQRNTDLQPHDAKRHKMDLQPLLQPPPPPPPNRYTSAEPLHGQGQKQLGDLLHPDRNQHRLRFESAKTVAPLSSSLTVPGAAYSPISPPAPFGVAPPPPPPPLPPSQPPLPPPPLPPNSRPM